ncbi:ion channel [Methanobrevibacter sp.]|uniref:ion channel n=1 Tax=Methanobrevibacter sp. TaxID=66852 RepID=UPI00386EF645
MLENYDSKDALYIGINLLILVDAVCIVYLLLFNLPSGLKNFILIFDVVLCVILLFDFFYKLQETDQKGTFFKYNVLFLIASIPFELFLPVYFMAFRFMLLLKLFKLSGVLERYFESIHRFIEGTKFDKIVTWIVFVVIVFTLAIYLFDSTLGLFDSLWYVVVTLTTVGYGDIMPNTFPARLVSLLLLVMGIFVFSMLTGAISSYFTDKILNIESDAEQELSALDEKLKDLNSQLKDIKEELEQSRAENKELHKKLDEVLKK